MAITISPPTDHDRRVVVTDGTPTGVVDQHDDESWTYCRFGVAPGFFMLHYASPQDAVAAVTDPTIQPVARTLSDAWPGETRIALPMPHRRWDLDELRRVVTTANGHACEITRGTWVHVKRCRDHNWFFPRGEVGIVVELDDDRGFYIDTSWYLPRAAEPCYVAWDAAWSLTTRPASLPRAAVTRTAA